MPLLTSGTTTISAVKVTRVVSVEGDGAFDGGGGSRVIVGGAGDGGKDKFCAQFVGGHYVDLESFLTGFPVAVLSTVKRLTKAKVAVGSVDVGSVAVGLHRRIVGARCVGLWLGSVQEVGEAGEDGLLD